MTPTAPPEGDGAAALRGHAERAGIGMLSLAPDGTILWANQALADLLGIEAGECAGRCFGDFQPDEGPARDLLEALARGEARQAFPMRLLHKSGSFRHVLVYADVQLHDGHPLEARCFVADVTGIQRDERTQQTLAAIVSSSDDAIVSKSLDGVIRSWNEGAERIFGYAAEEVVGRPITMIIPPALHDEEWAILARLSRGERIDHYETVRVAKDGRRVDVSLTVSPVRDASGRIVGASKVGRDITARKASEQALAEADRRKDEFLATLAHELRNPLAPLSNMLQVLELGDDDPGLRREATATMRRQVTLLVRLVDDLLDVARITRGKLQLRKSRIAVAEVVAGALAETRHLLEASGHELSVTLPEEAIYLDADAVRIGQVLTNLLINAFKYTPAGGRITLEADRVGTEARVIVSDTGVGIAADQLDTIFDMFAQLKQSLENGESGLGVGLGLVKSLVGLHGGRVTARSDGPGRGSAFEIRLPLARGERGLATEPADEPAPHAAARRYRVLVVDDNPDVAAALAALVERLGHDVRTSLDGVDALAAAEAFEPDLVLLDIGLPGINGYEVAKRIRARAWGRGIMIAATTGWGQVSDRASTRAAGCDVHLTKPVSLEALSGVLEQLPR